MLDQVFIQIELPVHVVVRGAGKPGRHSAGEVGNPIGRPRKMLSQDIPVSSFQHVPNDGVLYATPR